LHRGSGRATRKAALSFGVAAGWQFAENPKNLIELCHNALEAIEVFIRLALTKEANAQTASTA
jgi:hypothetical protein